jgi:hypothetical protein
VAACWTSNAECDAEVAEVDERSRGAQKVHADDPAEFETVVHLADLKRECIEAVITPDRRSRCVRVGDLRSYRVMSDPVRAATGGEISDDRPRHRAPGIGPAGSGTITVHATDTRGRITAWETAFEPIDDASLARLRDHLTAVLGTKPVDRDGALTWKGKPTVMLSVSTGEFRLSAD